MKKNILNILTILFAIFLNAQDPVYMQFSEKDGLPDIEFYNMMEDSKGFIWLAADKGFYRYDGKEFKHYTNTEKRGLSVFDPIEDSKGRIWCSNISGQFFYVENDELITFFDLGKLENGQLGHFIVTETHLLIFGSRKLYKVSLETKEVELKLVDNSNDLEISALGVPCEYENNIYLTVGQDVVVLDENHEIKKRVPLYGKKSPYGYIDGKARVVSIKDQLYVLFKSYELNYLLYFDINTGKIKEIVLPEGIKSNHIVTILSNKNAVLFSTDEGIWSYAFEDEKFTYQTRYLKKEYVSKIVIDRNKNYWISTLRNGVFVVPNIDIKQYDFPAEIEHVACIEKINDYTFFFGTTNGQAGLYNIKNQKIDFVKLEANTKVTSALYNKYKNELYISQHNRCYVYNLNTNELVPNKKFVNRWNMSLIDANSFFHTSYAGAGIVRNKNDLKYFYTKKDDGANVKRAYTGYHDSITKKNYISYVDDFTVYDKDFNAKAIKHNDKSIFAIHSTQTVDGTIWVSTFKNGIYAIKNDSVVKNYTTASGLVSNQTQQIKGDGNNLWIVTDKGIQLLDTKHETFETLSKNGGILTYLITGIEIFDDIVVFSSNKGIFSVDKKNVFKVRPKPELYFTSVQINEKDTLLQQKYNLPYDQNAVKINFNSNGFASKENIKYQSRLVGFNDNWIPISQGVDFVKYNSLPVGDYTFQVKAISTLSKKESEILTLKLAIKSPFWKKAWFIASIVFGILLLIILYYKSILIKREKQKNKELEKLAQERELVFLKLENLRSQMNPHFIFNALNSIQEYIILNKKNLASDYLGKFADLIRTYLNHSNKGAISVQDEVDCLEMYLELEQLRFEDKLNYFIHVSNIDSDICMIPTMLIQPYVENALKHGLLHKKNNRILTIELKPSEEKGMIICTIEDNGIGREKAFEIKARKDTSYESLGTQVTKDRLDLLNYGKEKPIGVTIEDLYEEETKNAKGTKVSIIIPTSSIE